MGSSSVPQISGVEVLPTAIADNVVKAIITLSLNKIQREEINPLERCLKAEIQPGTTIFVPGCEHVKIISGVVKRVSSLKWPLDELQVFGTSIWLLLWLLFQYTPVPEMS